MIIKETFLRQGAEEQAEVSVEVIRHRVERAELSLDAHHAAEHLLAKVLAEADVPGGHAAL
jgi:hypothetical protein